MPFPSGYICPISLLNNLWRNGTSTLSFINSCPPRKMGFKVWNVYSNKGHHFCESSRHSVPGYWQTGFMRQTIGWVGFALSKSFAPKGKRSVHLSSNTLSHFQIRIRPSGEITTLGRPIWREVLGLEKMGNSTPLSVQTQLSTLMLWIVWVLSELDKAMSNSFQC